jgi:hypothetical protein
LGSRFRLPPPRCRVQFTVGGSLGWWSSFTALCFIQSQWHCVEFSYTMVGHTLTPSSPRGTMSRFFSGPTTAARTCALHVRGEVQGSGRAYFHTISASRRQQRLVGLRYTTLNGPRHVLHINASPPHGKTLASGHAQCRPRANTSRLFSPSSYRYTSVPFAVTEIVTYVGVDCVRQPSLTALNYSRTEASFSVLLTIVASYVGNAIGWERAGIYQVGGAT